MKSTAPNPWEALAWQPWSTVRETAVTAEVERKARRVASRQAPALAMGAVPPSPERAPSKPCSSVKRSLPQYFRQAIIAFGKAHASFNADEFCATFPGVNTLSLRTYLCRAVHAGILQATTAKPSRGHPQVYRLVSAQTPNPKP